MLGVESIERLLAEGRMGFAMSEIAGRRSDQLGDLMTVLELGAVDLDYRAPIPEQRLGRRLDEPSLARAGRT
jgi:hypothetical protein